MSELMTTTYSMWRLFRNCRMACKWRYIDELVPLERDPNLAFGSVIHDCLECWHGERDLAKVLDHIDRTYPNRAQDDHQQADWHLARAMMSAYAKHYPAEEFEVVALEKTFEGPIVNPATGATSRSFILAGKASSVRMASIFCWNTKPPRRSTPAIWSGCGLISRSSSTPGTWSRPSASRSAASSITSWLKPGCARARVKPKLNTKPAETN